MTNSKANVSLNKRAVLVTLRMSLYSNRKTEKRLESHVANDHGAKSDAVVVRKRMFRSARFTKIKSSATAIRSHFYKYTLPWRDGGTRIIPSAVWMEFQQKLRQLTTKHNDLVSEFIEHLPEIIEAQKNRLGGLFDPRQFPTQAEMRDMFAVNYHTEPLPDASQFEDFRGQMEDDDIDRQKEDWKKEVAVGQKAAMSSIWDRLHESVKKCADKLSEPESIFRNTLIKNIKEMVEILPKLNIGDDQNFEKMRKQVEDELASLDPDLLRNSPRARENAAEDARELERRMAGYMGASNRIFDSLGLTGGK